MPSPKASEILPRALVFLLPLCVGLAEDPQPLHPAIPKVWDEPALRNQEVPVVVPRYSPKPVPADYYYKIPVRTIYKSYPIYAPGREPAGYLKKLKTVDPEIVFDPARLNTNEDWIRAGELVFEAPTDYNNFVNPAMARDPKWYEHTGVLLTKQGIMPYARYVVRQKGRVDVGNLSCSMCHTRALEDGTVIKAGPGNFPLDKTNGYIVRRTLLEENRRAFLALFWIP